MSIKPLSLNLSKMKKVAGDAHSSTFQHPSGHRMMIAHSGVSALQRKQLEKMPVEHLAEGGEAGLRESEDRPETDTKALKEKYEKEDSKVDSDAGQKSFDAAMASAPTQPDPGSVNASMLPPPQPPMQTQPMGGATASLSPMPPQAGPDVPAQVPVAPPDQSVQQPGPATENFAQAYQRGQNAISEQQSVDTKRAKANAEIQQKDLADRQTFEQQVQSKQNEFMQHQQDFIKDFQADHINPSHYLENMGTGAKIATGIGLFLGGFAPGGHNPAFEMLNKQIDRDIAAQESRKNDQKTLMGANQALFHDQALAYNQTRINMNDIYDHKIQLAAAQLGTPQAKAAADAAHAKFAMENQGMLQQNAMRSAAMQGAASGNVDPAKLVQFLVPKEHQAKAFGEIEAAENTRHMADSINKSFEDAVKENTILRTGGGMLRTPGSVMAFHQSMQPTFKDLEGTVRQAAMDNTFKNLTPMPGDSDHTIAQKRAAKDEYLQSKMSAPTARGYGIDLSKYDSTAPKYSAPQQTVKTMNGIQYAQVPGGWKRVQ